MSDFRLQTSDFGLQEDRVQDKVSNANPEVGSPQPAALSEILSPELAAFEMQLKSLKPVAVEMAAGNVSDRFKTHSLRRTGHLRSRLLLRWTLIGGLAATLLLIALTLFGPDRVNNPPQYIPGNSHQIAEINTPESTHIEDQPLSTDTLTVTFRGGLTMRKQLAMLLDEMQPQGIDAIQPKQPDYPVMVIPVCQNARPLSPEAKQAFRQRLQRIDVW